MTSNFLLRYLNAPLISKRLVGDSEKFIWILIAVTEIMAINCHLCDQVSTLSTDFDLFL